MRAWRGVAEVSCGTGPILATEAAFCLAHYGTAEAVPLTKEECSSGFMCYFWTAMRTAVSAGVAAMAGGM